MNWSIITYYFFSCFCSLYLRLNDPAFDLDEQRPEAGSFSLIISENKIFDYSLAAALAEANSSLSWYNWMAMLIKFSQLIVSYAKSESSEFPLTKTNFVQQWVWCIHDRLFRKANSYSFHGLAQNIKQLSNYNEQTRSNVNKTFITNISIRTGITHEAFRTTGTERTGRITLTFSILPMGELFFLLYITKAGEKREVWRKSGHLGAHAREMTGGGRWGQKAGVCRLSRETWHVCHYDVCLFMCFLILHFVQFICCFVTVNNISVIYVKAHISYYCVDGLQKNDLPLGSHAIYI